VSKNTYRILPKADLDLDDQALYYGTSSGAGVGDHFLASAYETFALLAHPNMGWKPRFRHRDLKLIRMFRVKDFEQILVLYFPRLDGVEIIRVIHGSRNIAAVLRREGLT
jgi:toxin ParE1/3/4